MTSSPSAQSLPEPIERALSRDPVFQVTSVNGGEWINPYTGELINAPFGHADVARKHLLATRPWERAKPKALTELLYLRWWHFLRENMELQPAYHHFSKGLWLNPFTGRWEGGVNLDQHRVSERTMQDIADILSRCPPAQAGKMLPAITIETLVAQGASLADLAGGVAIAPAVATPARGLPVARPATPASVEAVPVKRDKRKSGRIALKQQFVKMLVRPPRIENYQLAVQYEAHSRIPRDFYDFIPLDQSRLLIAIGECASQGTGGGMMPMLTLDALRNGARRNTELIDLAVFLSDQLRLDKVPGSCLTLFAAVLNTADQTLSYLSLGHHPAILLRPSSNTKMEHLASNGRAITSERDDTFRASLKPKTVPLSCSDMLVIYTDGLWKRSSSANPEAGRMSVAVSCASHVKRSLAELVNLVIADAKGSSDAPQTNDLTVVALRVKEPGEQTGAFRRVP